MRKGWSSGSPALPGTIDQPGRGRTPRFLASLAIICATLVLGIISFALLYGGSQLLAASGSPYYFLAGLALAIAAALFLQRRRSGYWLYLAAVLATIPWSLWEVGTDRWGLIARLCAPLVLLVPLTLVACLLQPSGFERERVGTRSLMGFALLQLALALGTWIAVRDVPPHSVSEPTAARIVATGDWPSYGGDWRSDHYARLSQITPENVPALELAWKARLGGLSALGTNSRFTATPLAIDGTLYLCDPLNRIVALDGTSGKEKWRYDPHADASKAFSIVCRGVSYHRGAGDGACASRILEGTLDARLVAVDAATGSPCRDFGRGGSVDLVTGVESAFDGYYYVTSPPAIIGDLAVIGGYVIDNQSLDPARSVIRAYDATSGRLVWTWDAGSAGEYAPEELFSPGNPNAWTVFSADPELGLVYVPTGNSSPDFFGGQRFLAAERYGTSIVALDAAEGTVKWSFQAVHHDLWDYDMPAQPALIDFPVGDTTMPALAVATKTGKIFVLDRRDGTPLVPVAERRVPASSVAGERASPTQPYPVGMPSFAGPPVREEALWGATPIDHMLCRLQFRKLRYQGAFTPPSVAPFLMSPGTFGAINWGGISVDRKRGMIIVNSSDMPFVGQLVPREQADRAGASPYDPQSKALPGPQYSDRPPPPMAMAGTPFGLYLRPFLSVLHFPCVAPPWGRISAIDLATRQLVWTKPLGTSRGLDPLGLALPVGIFNLGGSIVTAGGLTFIGATTDSQFRAIETATGREVWRADLPAGGQATPLSYAGRDGRQYVAIVAGGHGSLRTKRGDYVVAYALPNSAIGETNND